MPKETESYSREAYESEEKKLEALKKDVREGGDDFSSWPRPMSFAVAQERLAALKNEGHKEALALNKEWEKLREQAINATKALADFEKDKLSLGKWRGE